MSKIFKVSIFLIGVMLVSSITAYASIVSGTITLLNYDAPKTGITGTATITDGTNTQTNGIVLDGSGNYSFITTLSGNCTITVKCSHWLAKAITDVVVAGNTEMDSVTLINGDVVDNNEVDFSDINAVRAAYGSFPGDETWNEMADVDGSGEVDFSDINIVRSNYGEIGDIIGELSPIEMIYIPAGSFLMGNSGIGAEATYSSYFPEELPQHSVILSSYYIGKYEVTRGQYRQFMNAGGYSNSSYWSTDGWSWKVSNNRTEPDFWAESQDWASSQGEFPQPFLQTENHPVVGVTYYEAEAFCNWAGGHLPTEAQWERAARWNVSTSHPNAYTWGDTWNDEYCNNIMDSNIAGGGYQKYQTSPVGSYSDYPSPSGCQDMAGNVNEWCQDWYKSYPGSSSPFDYTNSYRVLRGSSWYGNVNTCRCAYRYYYNPVIIYYGIGFRLVR